jgi:DNA primase
MTAIDEIKARIDIVDLVSETVQLRRSGKSYTGFCPFHQNTRTPSFAVWPESGTWRCFGQCNDGGDIFQFVMKKEGWDFAETLRHLAERAGVELKPISPQQAEQVEEHDRLRLLLEEAVTFYRHQLLNTSPGKQALGYLKGRGLDEQTIEAFGLGYAPQTWQAVYDHFTGKGFSEKDLQEAGLISPRDSGGFYDRFRHRVMFPIRDERGRMAGFGARILNPDDLPKFLNSPQTPVFDKGHLLYGLDRARKAIRTQDQAVIVEGYLDVIALHQHGFTNAVSPMGTALTEMQLRLLKRLTRRIVLALDADTAGEKATLRGLEIARQTLDRESDPIFDARGLVAYEGRLKADIRVTTLPEGMDPDDVVNQDPAEWERILSRAKPIIEHVMATLAAGRDLDDPKVKNEIAQQVLPLIEDVASAIERDTYRQRLARLLRVDERSLLPDGGRAGSSWRPARGRRGVRTRPDHAVPALLVKDASQALEAYCLGILLRRPDLIDSVDRHLQSARLGRLTSHDFQYSQHQAIFNLLVESLGQDVTEPLHYVLNGLSQSLMDSAEALLASTDKMDPKDNRVLDDLMRTVLDLRRRDINLRIEQLRFLMEEEQESGDLRASSYAGTMQQWVLGRQLLDKALGLYTGRQASIQK